VSSKLNDSRLLLSFSGKLGLHQKIFLISICLSLGLGKWGAWIGIPNLGIFLIDVMFFSSVFIYSFGKRTEAKYPRTISIIVLLFISFQFIRSQNMPFPLVLRDLLPYIYLVSLPFQIDLIRSLSWKDLISIMRLGVLINLIWTIPITIGILKPITILSSYFGVPIFTSRYDLTGIILSLGILVFGNFRNYGLRSSSTLRLICIALGLLQSSRAATIAVLLSLLFVISQSSWYQKRRIIFWSSLVLTILICTVSIFPNVFESLTSNSSLTRFGLIGDNSFLTQSANSTSAARVRAAEKLLTWFDNQDQLLMGVGPGIEMVQLSGAVANLSGSVEVRAPHNWFIGLFVRYGIVGTIIWVGVVLHGFYLSRNARNWLWRVEILIICLVAGMGVIIESPFGSLPFSFLLAITFTQRER